MSSGKIVLGLLTGLAVGALAGILFAPAKGSKTRKRILQKGEGYLGSFKEQVDELLDTVSEKIEKVKEDVDGYAETKMSQLRAVEKTQKKAEL